VGKKAYIAQTLGNDFFYSNAQFSFNYLRDLTAKLNLYGPEIIQKKITFKGFMTLSEYMNFFNTL